MRLTWLVAAALAASMVPAHAAEAIWRGDAFVVASSGTCSHYEPKGNHYVVRFLPRNVGTNGPDSRFAWYQSDYAQGFYLPAASFNATAQAVTYHSIWDGGSFSPNFPVTVAFTSQSPAAIAATTKFLSIQGVITNYDFMQGCTVNFRMALGLSTN